MLVDSHCHLQSIDLQDFNNDLNELMRQAKEKGVERFLSVCVELGDYPALEALAKTYKEVNISVGIHPNTEMDSEITEDILCDKAKNPSCIAIGETGLDYYRTSGADNQWIQKNRFRTHIGASLRSQKPLIIHTRQAAEDTLSVMKEEHADEIGGVMHCFSETWDVAKRAMDLNFYLSFSGIVTFKNALTLQETVKKMPMDRILIETDAPYLAPVPFRGKQNHPALVVEVAKTIAHLKGISLEEVAAITTSNFKNCFRV